MRVEIAGRENLVEAGRHDLGEMVTPFGRYAVQQRRLDVGVAPFADAGLLDPA